MRRVGWLLVLLVALPAGAQWDRADELPEWARPGVLHWALQYSRANRALVDLYLKHHQTMLQGASFDSPETARYAQEHGLRLMPYVCSRTFTTGDIAKDATLRQAVLLKPDGSDFLAYNNPVRRYGSLFNQVWPDFVKGRTRQQMAQLDTSAIFYDNAFMPEADYRPEGIAGWQTWARQHGFDPGQGLPQRWDDPRLVAYRAFVSQVLTRYYQDLRSYCHQGGMIMSPNAGGMSPWYLAAAEQDAVDMVFYETETHPPFVNNGFIYKAGLAAAHGRSTGMLAYLPSAVAEERGVRTWNEGMHAFFYPSSPLPDEFALAAAEGAANGGTYIPNYDLFPSLAITDVTDPFNQRIYRSLQQQYDFLAANADLYRQARPGSNVGVLYSPMTHLLDRSAVNFQALADALTAAGIPYEIVVPSDFTRPTPLAIDTLLVPNITIADDATAAGVLRWAQQGGHVVVTGAFATRDLLGRPHAAPDAAKLLAPLRIVSPPFGSWQLTGFVQEGDGAWKVDGQLGTARLPFAGQRGSYVAHVLIRDENDGESTAALSVGGKTVCTMKLDRNDEQPRWFDSPAFDLAPGDVVTLTVRPDGGEAGRTQAVILAAADRGGAAACGRGTVAWLPLGLDQVPPERRREVLRPNAWLPQPGKVSVNRLDPPVGAQVIHLLNYDFRYEVSHPDRFGSDDGRPEARTYFADPKTVVRKRIAVPNPQAVGGPTLQLHGFATQDCRAPLIVTVNGRRIAALDPTQANRRVWQSIPLPREVLAADNLVELRAEGELDGMKRWWQVDIDTDATTGNSSFSLDGGQTFSTKDLSPDLGNQTGEYLIRILNDRPGAPDDPGNLAANPGFERVQITNAETKLTVIPAKDVEVRVAGAPRPALAISPDGPPVTVTGTADGATAIYRVPSVRIYTVLVLDDRAKLDALAARQNAAAPWTLPEITAPPKAKVADWTGYGNGFTVDEAAHTGKYALRCEAADTATVAGAMQTIALNQATAKPITLTAWSRASNVGGRADQDYSLYVDATCMDGTVFNGHHTPFAVDTHEWQQATLKLEPTKPLKTMTVYVLFRRHTGTAWFDDVRITANGG